MCACVNTTQSIVAGSTDRLSQFRCRNSLGPSNNPQSISSLLPCVSSRYLEPVTVPAAPRNVILGIWVLILDRRAGELVVFLGAHWFCRSETCNELDRRALWP